MDFVRQKWVEKYPTDYTSRTAGMCGGFNLSTQHFTLSATEVECDR
jgi:hypothetical protein